MKTQFPLMLLVICLLMACHAKKPNNIIPKPDEKPISEDVGKDTVVPAREPEILKKPIIYLYPTQTMDISVALELKGKLTHTYPKYPAAGWKVEAQPNGDLVDKATGKQYYALFWEGEGKQFVTPTEGFVVAGENTASFLEEKLAILGLSAREANEFIIYWLPLMENNAYNLIHFAGESYTESATLNIAPKPETLIRVFMLFQSMNYAKPIKEQILTPMLRKGFTVVEWGGTELKAISN